MLSLMEQIDYFVHHTEFKAIWSLSLSEFYPKMTFAYTHLPITRMRNRDQ